MSWLIRILMASAGIVAGWFIPRDQLGYTVIQLVVLLLLILVVSVVVLYFPRLRSLLTRLSAKKSD